MSSREKAKALGRREEGALSASSTEIVGATACDGPQDSDGRAAEDEQMCERFCQRMVSKNKQTYVIKCMELSKLWKNNKIESESEMKRDIEKENEGKQNEKERKRELERERKREKERERGKEEIGRERGKGERERGRGKGKRGG